MVDREALNALNTAVLAVSSELSLEKVLQVIVDAARELVDAEYAALGVPNRVGGLDAFIHSGISSELVKKMGQLPRGKGLLGVIIRDKRPIRLANLGDDPHSVGFPAHHPPMSSFVGVPIVGGNEVYGNLYLTNKIGASEFSEDDLVLVKMLASHAAVAIQNARLYEQVERLAVLEERNRIGMDLHDGVIQSIYAVALTLESARYSLTDGNKDADQLIGTAVSQLNNAIQDIRNFIMDLRPRRFRGELRDGLSQLVREFQANTNTPIEMTFDGAQQDALTSLSVTSGRTLFLTTQESLANIARHAQADTVQIHVTCEDERVTLRIKDNGVGFDLSSKSQKIGHGLSNMELRAEERNGRFELTTAPGQGTEIMIVLPLSDVTMPPVG